MRNFLILMLVLGTFASCKEGIWNAPQTGGATPSAVKSYTIKNLPGKAVIHFTVPDENTMYVVAEYTLGNGVAKNVKASRFTDSLVLDGFSQAQNYNVQLYAVGENEQKSSPTSITVAPTIPTYLTSFQSLKPYATFGGVTIEASNPQKDALVIETLRKRNDGTWESLDRYYTSMEKIKFTVRGLQPTEQNLAFFVRDRFLNYSDTLKRSVVPWVEIQVPVADITEISAATMPGSAPIYNNSSTYNAKKAFDGITTNYYLGARGTGMPQHFNIDLKKTYSLSRLVFYQRASYYYKGISPRKWAIWGSTSPALDANFTTWILLGTFEVIKPSGKPMDEDTDEDTAAALAGHNFEFDGATIPVRYLRFQTLETWAQADYITFREFDIFGDIAR